MFEAGDAPLQTGYNVNGQRRSVVADSYLDGACVALSCWAGSKMGIVLPSTTAGLDVQGVQHLQNRLQDVENMAFIMSQHW